MAHNFISYSRKDRDRVTRIVKALEDRGLDVWIDQEDIPKGEEWQQEIYRGIETADALLFMISPDSVISEMCGKEISHAVLNNKRIIPVVIRDTDSKVISPEISKLNWILCRDDFAGFEKAIGEIDVTIHTNYEWVAFHTKLQTKALDWDSRQDSSRLLRGKELKEVEKRLAESVSKEPLPSDLMRHFILRSRQAHDRQRKLIYSISFIVVIIFIAILSYRSVMAGLMKRQAQETGIMVGIGSGEVLLGDDLLAESGEALNEREYRLEGYQIEIYEVTNQRYSLCVSAGYCTPPNGPIAKGNDANKPVAQVTVVQAMEFCEWIDRRLPTELEWERSARYTDFRRWPWSDIEPPTNTLYAKLNYEKLAPNLVSTQDVGSASLGVSEEGIYDLVGNVWEWTCTPSDSTPDTCWSDPSISPFPASFVIRGGGANLPPNSSLNSAYRQSVDWDFNQSRFIGFRCVDAP